MTKFFINNSKVSHFLVLIIILLGVFNIFNVPRQDMPNVEFDLLTISTFYPGAAPQDVEINVTDPIEDELEKLDGIEQMTSFSIEGVSMITVTVDPEAKNIEKVKDDIRNAVNLVKSFPQAVEDRPLVEEMKSTDFPVLEIAIIGKNSEESNLRKVAKALENEIKAATKVGTIGKIGYRKREIKILSDLEKMDRNYVSFTGILQAIHARNVRSSGGTLESFVDEKKIVTYSEFENVMDVGEVIIRSNNAGKKIKVKDVAKIVDGFRDRTLISRTNGKNSINLIVKRRGATDIIKLSEKINIILERYKNLYKKEGIEIVKVVDYTYYTKSLLNIVTNNAIIGFFLVCLALFFFLNFHTAIWVALGIPLSILAAYMFFPIVDVSTNQIALITIILVLGMLVDDAIVVAENITRHQDNGMDFKKAALLGTKEMFPPVLATILTTILCFVPILFMTGILGKFIRTIPIVVILTLLASLFESTTLLPFHLSLRKHKGKESKKVFMEKIKFFYEKILRKVLFNPWKTIILFTGTSLILSAGILTKSRFEMFPSTDYDLFYIVMEAKNGNSLEETYSKVKHVEKEVSKISKDLLYGFKTIVGNHKTDEAASDASSHNNWSVITIFLHPAGKRDVKSEKIIEDLKIRMKPISGFEKLTVRAMKDGPPVGAPITVRLVSDKIELCKKYEMKILELLHNSKGVFNISSSNREGKKEIHLKLNHSYMASLGITAIDLSNVIRIAYDGKIATSIRREGEEIDFRLQLENHQRSNLDQLKQMKIRNNQDQLISIGKFVNFEETTSLQSIQHFNGRRSITIKADVHSEQITSIEANSLIEKNFSKEIAEIPNLALVFGGEGKQTNESFKNFLVAFIVAIICIYLILVLLLDSYSQPFLILVAVPFGFVGVLIAFFLHGIPMSFIGIIGSLGMIGVVVNDSLVMVTYINKLIQKNGEVSNELIIDGAKTRLRPVLLTTITTVLGLMPTVYGWGGTEPFLVPMVLAMSWGLVFATLITLIFIPTLYTFSRTK